MLYVAARAKQSTAIFFPWRLGRKELVQLAALSSGFLHGDAWNVECYDEVKQVHHADCANYVH